MQPQVFERSDLIITNPFPRLPWEETKPEDRHTIHWGQRKLTLAEIEFFSLYWDPRKISKPLCVHVGDPGPGLDMLCQMFPAITWHIYYQGRQPLKVLPPQVTFFNQSFTDKVATKYGNQDNIFFISDYRSTDYHVIESEIFRANGINLNQQGQPMGNRKVIKDLRRQAERANEEAIASDMRDQQRWFLIINPAHGLLKFRPPYALSRTDQGFAYLSGRVYWQAWARPTSTETRLKPTRDENGNYTVDSNLNALEYEEWCFYHNMVRREKGVYRNPLTGAVGPIDSPHLQADYDSALEAYILSLYWRRFAGVRDDLLMLVLSSSHYLTFVLNNQHPDPSTWTTLASKRSALTSARPIMDPFSPQSTPDTSRSIAESFSPSRLSETTEAEPFVSERMTEPSAPERMSELPSRPLSPPRASVPLLQPTMHSPFKRANNLQVIPDFSTQEDVVINLEDLGLKPSSVSASVSSPPEEVQEEPLVAVARKPITLAAAPKATGKATRKGAKEVVPPPEEVVLPSVAAIPQRPLTNFPTGRAQTTVLEGLNEPSIRPQINIVSNAPTKAAPKVSASSVQKVSASESNPVSSAIPKVSASTSSAVPKMSAAGSTPKSVPKMVPKSTAKAVPKMVPSKASAKTSAPPK